MPSIRSIGRTDSRMIASAFSTSFIRRADILASGESMLWASFIMRSRLGLDLGAHPHRHRLDLLGVGIGLGLGQDRRAAVGAGVLLGAGSAGEAKRLALGGLARADQLDRLPPLGHLDLAGGEHLLLGRDGGRARLVGGGLGLALRLALPGDRDRPLLLGEVEAMRRSISAAWIVRSLPIRSCSIVCSERMRAASIVCLAAICALSPCSSR